MSLLLAPVASAAASVYRITGQAVNARDGAPIPYCRIVAAPSQTRASASTDSTPLALGRELRPGRGISGAARSPRVAQATEDSNETTADASGHFTLDLPHAGGWALRAQARGFREQHYDEHEGFFSSVVLTAEAPVFNALFRLMPDAIVRGRVIDEAGDPVAHGQVLLERMAPAPAGAAPDVSRQRPAIAALTVTDDQGLYELTGLASGVYRLRVNAQPWYAQATRGVRAQLAGVQPAVASPDPSLDVVFPTTWYPAATEEAGAEELKPSPGEELEADMHLTAITAAHLVMPRLETASQEDTGPPRPQRQISVTRVGSDFTFGQTTFIGGVGRTLDFGSLAPGSYEVRIPGATPGSEEVRQVEVRPGSSVVTLDGAPRLTQVTVRCDGECGDRVPLIVFDDVQTGRRITANLRMHVRKQKESNAPEVESTIVMLPPHRYEVGVYANQDAYVSGLQATGAKVSGKSVEIGDQAALLTVQLGNGRGEVRGTVTLAGKVDSGAMVLLVPISLGQPDDQSVIARDQSNTDGSYTFAGVIPGRYILVAIDHGWAADWRSMAGLAGYLAKGLPVEVAAGGKVVREIGAVTP